MAEEDEEIPGRPVFCVGGREELKTRGGSLSSERANGEVQAERSTPIKVLRSLEYSNSFISNADTTFNIIEAHLHGNRYTRIVQFSESSPVDRDLTRSPHLKFKMKLHL
jgi:hypothetical protein